MSGGASGWLEGVNTIRLVRNALISKDSDDKNTCACAAIYTATVAGPEEEEPSEDDEEGEEEGEEQEQVGQSLLCEGVWAA